MQNNRIIFLDMVKAVSIFLVVFCHYVTLPSDTIMGNVIMTFSWCAVPCFFMVTGSLLHVKTEISLKKHIKKVVSTYFVICCWKVLYLLFYCIIGEMSFSKAELVNYIFLFGDINNVNVGHIWFMYAYMVILLFYPISYYIMASENKMIQIYTGILLFLAGMGIPAIQFLCTLVSTLLNINDIKINSLITMIPFGRYVNMLFYFFIGGFIFKYRKDLDCALERRNIKRKIFITIVIGILGNMIVKYTYTKSFQWQGVYLVDGYNRVSTMFMALGLYMFIMVMKKNKICEALAEVVGRNTMGIYFLHMPILNLFSILIYPYLQAYYSVGLNIIKTVFTILLCIMIVKIVKKIPYLKFLIK